MARRKKKLNKKVLFVGSLFFVFLLLAGIWVILKLTQDPQKFVEDGDVAMKAADEIEDEETRLEEYAKAAHSYHKARSLAKTDSLRVEVLFKLIELYLRTDEWNFIRGCWGQVIQLDPKNAKARYGLLKYIYILADSGAAGAGGWKEIVSQATEFIEDADEGVLASETAEWESFGEPLDEAVGKKMESYLYLIRGRAAFETVKMGAVANFDESLALAIEDLEKVLELDPTNVGAYFYLAQSLRTKGEMLASRGDLEGKDEAVEEAKKLLDKSVELAEDNPKAHINHLWAKATFIGSSGSIPSREQVELLESEFLSLTEKFDSSPEAFGILSRYYRMLGHKNLDKAITAIERAISLDKQNVMYAMSVAELHYRKFSVYGEKAELNRAIEIAEDALAFPDVQDKPGPRMWANKRNNVSLNILLAGYYIEQVRQPVEELSSEQKQNLLDKAELAVHEIEQYFASGESPQVIKWQGMLELAKGNRTAAIKKLYVVYDQTKASGGVDIILSYTLAKLFKNSTETGAAFEFFRSAFDPDNLSGTEKIYTIKPNVLLDYAELLLKMREYIGALNYINSFETMYQPNQKSQRLRISAYINAKQFDEAEEKIAELEPEDMNTLRLKFSMINGKINKVRSSIAQRKLAEKEDELKSSEELMTVELNSYMQVFIELADKMFLMDPNVIGDNILAIVFNNYIAENKIEQAKDLVKKYLAYSPENVTLLNYKQILNEPEPASVTQERGNEILLDILSNIADPVVKSEKLAAYYRVNNELDKAEEESAKVFKIEDWKNSSAEQLKKITISQYTEMAFLFERALSKENWQMANQIADIIRKGNLDSCEGNFYTSRISIAKAEYKDALEKLNKCLELSPVFSEAYKNRSIVNAALENEHASIEDIKKAASWNLLDGNIARSVAMVLYNRNVKLGDNVTADQVIETKDALLRAIKLNPGNSSLQGFYADYISTDDPKVALTLRQNLQKMIPSLENTLLLGTMAMRMAVDEVAKDKKEVLFGIAVSAFEQAMAIDPQNKMLLNSYAEYYRLTGQEEKAEKMLAKSEDKRLLYAHYYQAGQFGEAKKILEKLYQDDAKDATVLKGLVVVAEKLGDKDAVKKYSNELISVEDDVENNLLQIQTFLNMGLVKESENKLQSLGEKYPAEPKVLLLKAWLALKQGRLKEALELTNRNLEMDKENATAWRLRGEINRLMTNYDQAVSDLKHSKTLYDDPATRLILAKTYLRAGRVEDALTELESTINLPGASMESRSLLERVYRQLGRLKPLERFYEDTAAKYPDSVYWMNRAGELALVKKNYERAETLFKSAWEKGNKSVADDVSTRSLDGYLQALAMSGKIDKVIEVAHQYVDGIFAPQAFFGIAGAKIALGDKDAAIEYCRKAVDIAVANDENSAYNMLRRMYSLLGNDEVQKYCMEKLQSEPDSIPANFTMYQLASLKGEYNEAITYIDNCIKITGHDDPNVTQFVEKKALLLQELYVKTSDEQYLKAVITEYENLLEKRPDNPDVLNNLAYLMTDNDERPQDALKYAELAYKLRPNDAGVLDTYAYTLYKNEKYTKASEFSQASLQQYENNSVPPSWDVYEHLGMIKEKLGEKNEAADAYEQALKAGADTLTDTVKERINSAIQRLSN